MLRGSWPTPDRSRRMRQRNSQRQSNTHCFGDQVWRRGKSGAAQDRTGRMRSSTNRQRTNSWQPWGWNRRDDEQAGRADAYIPETQELKCERRRHSDSTDQPSPEAGSRTTSGVDRTWHMRGWPQATGSPTMMIGPGGTSTGPGNDLSHRKESVARGYLPPGCWWQLRAFGRLRPAPQPSWAVEGTSSGTPPAGWNSHPLPYRPHDRQGR
mmetsp:Transcript_23287/g.67178  ORF Transcript_23287/g.67178 Transcript_23287/m.67178 type:complete len:210 (-) Transcript_23287:737-1366(-)